MGVLRYMVLVWDVEASLRLEKYFNSPIKFNATLSQAFSPFIEDVELEELSHNSTSGLEPLSIKQSLFILDDAYMSLVSQKHVTTHKKEGINIRSF